MRMYKKSFTDAVTRACFGEVVYVEELTREELIAIILELRERVAFLEKENAELRSRLGGGDGTDKPEWVKPNRKERREAERAVRKKRTHSFARKRDIPTKVICHAVESCPDCGRKLSGGWVHDRRQVIEIPDAPVVNADVTGWREDGINGYIWSFSTPSVRYLLYKQSRASAMVKEALGGEFAGALAASTRAQSSFTMVTV